MSPLTRGLLCLLVSRSDRLTIMNDLAELYQHRRTREGERAAAAWLRRQVAGYPLRLISERLRRPLALEHSTCHIGGDRRSRSPIESARDVLRDLRYSLRSLARSPGLAVTVVLTLALGIGANTAIFSVVNGLLLDMVPFESAEELIFLSERPKGYQRFSVAYPNFLDWQERQRSFESMAAHRKMGLTLTGSGMPEHVTVLQTSASLFPLLRVEPVLGRTFTAEEDQVGGPRTVVISYGFWQRQLGARDDAVGSKVTLDGEAWEVIGVMPQGFTYPLNGSRVEIWMPLGQISRPWIAKRGSRHGIYVTARLASGTSLERARADMDRIAAELAAEYPESNAGAGVNTHLLSEMIVGDLRPALLVLCAAAGLVLLIACVNVANLLLARGAARNQEIAVRAAVGSSRWQVTRQLLIESVLLSLAGGITGLLVAKVGLGVLLASIDPDYLPKTSHIAVDHRVLLFALAVSVVTGLLFGLAPVLQSLRHNLVEALKGTKRSSGVLGHRRSRDTLVIAETALALVLLVGAALFLRTFYELVTADPGFDSHNVLYFGVSLPPDSYPEKEQQAAFFDQLVTRLEALPGVVSAGTILPFMSAWYTGVTVEGQPPPAAGEQLESEIFWVSPQLFDTLGLRLLRGRLFDQRDRPGSKFVAVIDELYAETFWPGADPLGKRIKSAKFPAEEYPWLEIVGVVNHVKSSGVNKDSRIQLYLPMAQFQYPYTKIMVKTTVSPRQLISQVEREVQAIDPHRPILSMSTLEELMAHRVTGERLVATLLVIFAVLALVLAAIGLYGVVAHAVSERQREIGIRMALGARSSEVLGMVVVEGLRLVLAGIVLGLAVVLPLTPLVAGQLFGVGPRDPATLVAIPLLLAMVAVVACAVPAHRASHVEPVSALHDE